MNSLEFGVDSRISLPGNVRVFDNQEGFEEIQDISGELVQALNDPIEYPSLAQIVIPEDRIAIMLDEGVPCVDEIVACLLTELLQCGIAAERICVVHSGVDGFSSNSKLSKAVIHDLEILKHDPADREGLAYLGPSKDQEPVYINRKVVDADVAIPIGVSKQSPSLGYFGPHGCLVQYADEKTQHRFFRPKSAFLDVERTKRVAEVNEMARLLGTRMTIQVIPGGGESVHRFLVGDAKVVEKQAAEYFDRIWRAAIPNRANLVISALPGGPQQQTWNNFARALSSASRIVEQNGAIAVCCDLKSKPGLALRKLAGAEDFDIANRIIANENTADSVPAAQLIRALEHARVYLLSNLNEDDVEDLGMAYVANSDEISRLASRHDSCVAIGNAHITAIELAENE